MEIGVSGYGYSGSSAVLALIKEYDEICSSDSGRVFEFCLPYAPDGLLDLEYHLTKAPAKHLKGDIAIHRFKKYVNFIARSYNRETHDRFSSLTNAYLDEITQVSYRCRRLSDHGTNKASIFCEKLSSIIQTRAERLLKKRVPIRKEDTRYISVYPENFLENTKKYLQDIIESAGLRAEGKHALLDQPFPPNFPEQVFHFFEDPKAIIVNRDPRDIYVTVKHLTMSAGRFVPHDTVEDFVKYYRAIQTHSQKEDSERVLRISFEDLIYSYDETVKKIETFLGISQHGNKKKFFNPDLSIKNTQLKDVFPEDKEDILYIESELKEFLYPFEGKMRVADRDGIYKMAHW